MEDVDRSPPEGRLIVPCGSRVRKKVCADFGRARRERGAEPGSRDATRERRDRASVMSPGVNRAGRPREPFETVAMAIHASVARNPSSPFAFTPPSRFSLT